MGDLLTGLAALVGKESPVYSSHRGPTVRSQLFLRETIFRAMTSQGAGAGPLTEKRLPLTDTALC